MAAQPVLNRAPNSDLYARTRRPSDMTIRVQSLLERYPDLDEEELATLIELFPYVPTIDVGVMAANDRLSEKFAAFHRDHGGGFAAPVKPLLAALAVPGVVAAGVLWWTLA